MTGLRGFGMSMQVGGPVRHWYVGSDGVRRWSYDDKPVDDFNAAMSVGIPPIGTPDPIADLETSEGLVGLQSDNCDIDVSESVYFRIPSDLPTLSPDEIAEGDARQEHCR